MGERSLLDHTYEAFRKDRVENVVNEFFYGLGQIRRTLNAEAWKTFIDDCRKHPIMNIIQQDPFTRRCYQKPRGYAGDAVVMDLIYNENPELTASLTQESDLGLLIYHEFLKHPETSAVRARKAILTEKIDETLNSVKSPKILSVGCGHLREAEASIGMKDNRAVRFTAIDQDPASLEVIRETWNGRIDTVCTSVIDILRKDSIRGTDFDLIYTAGLYDYLNDNLSERLTAALFGKLNAGGRLLIANFLAEPPNVAFMEVFMDWWLTYRDEEDMIRMKARIDPKELSGLRLYPDDTGCILFLELTKLQ